MTQTRLSLSETRLNCLEMKVENLTAATSSRLDRLEVTLSNLSNDISEIKNDVKQGLKDSYNSRTENVVLKSQVDTHETRIKKIEDALASLPNLIFQAKITAWLAAALMVLIIGFLFSILTHQVTVMLP